MDPDLEQYPGLAGSTFKALGTDVEIQIVISDEQQRSRALEDIRKARALFNLIEKRFSRFRDDSELSLFNKNIGKFLKASEEMRIVSQKSIRYYKKTESYFDPRIIEVLEQAGYDRDFKSIESTNITNKKWFPGSSLNADIKIEGKKIKFGSRMDFSGIVKGYAADKISKFVHRCGWKDFLVDAGGDIFFSGQNKEGGSWKVDIEGIPSQNLILEISNGGVATSGITRRKWEKNGRRFHHLVNPKNPENFSFEIRSVTSIAQTTEEADVWAKTIFLMGENEGQKFAKKKNIACVILEYRGNIWISPAGQKYLAGNKHSIF